MHGGTFWVGSFAEKLWPTPFSKAHLSSLNPFKLGRENKKLCFWRHCSGILWESFRWYQALTDFGSKLTAGQMLADLKTFPGMLFESLRKSSWKCGNFLWNVEICLEIWKYAWKYGNMLGNQNIVWFSWKSFHYLSQVTTCRRPDHYCFSEPHFAAPTIYSISMDVVFPTRPPPILSQKYIFDTNHLSEAKMLPMFNWCKNVKLTHNLIQN